MSEPTALFGLDGTALALRSQRLALLASNIANASTPGFKARDMDFSRALEAASHGTPADARQMAGMLAHWQQALVEIGFLDPAAPKKLMPRLNQLFNRASPSEEDIHILRGIAKTMMALGARQPH